MSYRPQKCHTKVSEIKVFSKPSLTQIPTTMRFPVMDKVSKVLKGLRLKVKRGILRLRLYTVQSAADPQSITGSVPPVIVPAALETFTLFPDLPFE